MNKEHGRPKQTQDTLKDYSAASMDCTAASKTDGEEDYPCGTCRNQVGEKDKALECDVCTQWFHTRCQSVSDKLYEILAEEEGNCSWYCSNCKHGTRNLRIQVIAIQREYNDIILHCLASTECVCVSRDVHLSGIPIYGFSGRYYRH